MKLVSDFQKRFRECLRSNNYTLTEYAKIINVSKQTISAYCNGVRKPKLPMIKNIAESFGVSEAWLLGFDVEKFLPYINYKITKEEYELLILFKNTPPEGQTAALAVLNSFKVVNHPSKNVV